MNSDRRKFLSDSAGALAAAPLFIPRAAWGANDRLAYGLIGAGGRGRYLSTVFQKLGAECVAIAEVYEPNLEKAKADAPNARTHIEYRDLLGQQGIDAVIVATPDHQHAPNLLAALQAKKDVYLEKPMSHSLEESKKMVDAVRKTKQIVQIGMQRRSAPMVRKAKEMVDSGILGKIAMVKPLWNWNVARPLNDTPLPGKLDWDRFLGPAKKRELQPMRFRSWRLFWDYSGGNMTDQGTHLMDVVQWFTNSGTPRSAISYGQIAKSEGSEVPDVFCAVFEYPKMMATWTLNYTNSYDNGWSIQFQGDEGTMIIDEAGVRVWKEPWRDLPNREPIHKVEAPVPVEAHIQNFMDCVKSRQEPNAPVEVGASAVAAPHLANVAFHKNRRVHLKEDGVSWSV
jgi:predicted dehydrogenase